MGDFVSIEDRVPQDDSIVVVANLSYPSDICHPDMALCHFLHGKFYIYEDGIEAENYDGGATIKLDMTITHWKSVI